MFNSRQLIILMIASLALAQEYFDWLCSNNSLAPCSHACFAVHCKGSAYRLNYDNKLATWPLRRTESGCNRNPCTNTHYKSFGNSCDSFPFPSTTQGGPGAILRCVTSAEENSVGMQLNNFYKNLPDGHEFGILVRNFHGAPFCNNASLCTNDGGEFKMVNGNNFVNARRIDENLSFKSVDSDSNVRTSFRRFMASDGEERLWLASPRDTTDTPVGRYAWNGMDEKVKIISEIHV